jgi:D-amino-acid dehydrogenase
MQSVDVVVLGAGMVGVSAALQLQARGKHVVLVDRRGAGEETSFGNAGIIEREAIHPVAPPRDLMKLMEFALNSNPAAHYHPGFLPRVLPWIARLFLASDSAGVARYASAMEPLSQRAAGAHEALMREANAEHFLRRTGWLRLFRTPAEVAAEADFHAAARTHGIAFETLSAGELSELEPHVTGIHSATLWPQTWTVSSPGGVTRAYADLFEARGGRFVRGDARSLMRSPEAWAVDTDVGRISAPDVVVALGPWSMDVLAPLGIRVPFAVKRGYHQHYRTRGNATLSRPVVDGAFGYVLTPMEQGIRLTTGIEFADRDAPKTPVQLDRVEPVARALFPLAERVENEPWMGRRPCLPDSLPIIGPAPGLRGLWLDFGHGHLGFTQGPISGQLIADLITGQAPVVDPTPYRVDRF